MDGHECYQPTAPADPYMRAYGSLNLWLRCGAFYIFEHLRNAGQNQLLKPLIARGSPRHYGSRISSIRNLQSTHALCRAIVQN